MRVVVSCSSCSSLLQVAEEYLGKHVRCPKCTSPFLAQAVQQAAAKPAAAAQSKERIYPRPPALHFPFRSKEEAVKEEAVKAKTASSSPRGVPAPEDDLPEFEVEEINDEPKQAALDQADDTPAPSRIKKKKGKKKKTRARQSAQETAWWVRWAIGGGVIVALMLTLLTIAVFSRPENSLKGYATYLFVMMPISTVIFFGAMYLSSIWFGAIEIGEIHVAFFKAFILVFCVNVTSLIPFGFYLTFSVWLGGLFVLFRVDLWEARVLIMMNWILNAAVKFLLFAALMSYIAHANTQRWNDAIDVPDDVPVPGAVQPVPGDFDRDDDR